MADNQSKALEVRIETIETNLQEIRNQLKDVLVILYLGGGSPRQQPLVEHVQVVVHVDKTPVLVPVHYHGRHDDYDGCKVKAKVPCFYVSLDDEDQEYVGDEENEEDENEEYTDEVCKEEQGDFVCIVHKILCLSKQEELT